MTVSDEAVRAAVTAYGATEYSLDHHFAMRRAIEAADKVRGGTLPVVPSEEAIEAVRQLYYRKDWTWQLALTLAYSIDGARDVGARYSMTEPPTETRTMAAVRRLDEADKEHERRVGSTEKLREILHGFRNITGTYGWVVVWRAELDAAMAELDALERK